MPPAIALCHFRVGETDGVSLEMEKWKAVLERMGHRVFYLAGSRGQAGEAIVIPGLAYEDPINRKLFHNAFEKLVDYPTGAALLAEIQQMARAMAAHLRRAIHTHGLEILMVNNIWSLGWHLPAALAFATVAREGGVRWVAHHHDFYWERTRYARPTRGEVAGLLEELFPPLDIPIRHVVINGIAREALRHRKGLDSTVVPNVFDFEAPPWRVDGFNRSFRQAIEVAPHDLLALQATRIVRRKAIELSIDLLASIKTRPTWRSLQDRIQARLTGTANRPPRLVLVLTGTPEEPDYARQLERYATQRGVCTRFIAAQIAQCRVVELKRFCFWDAYVFADFVTYPSIAEGFGNQLIEAVFAKKVIVGYPYPVFDSDLQPKGIRIVSLGKGVTHTGDGEGLLRLAPAKIDEAADAVLTLLGHPAGYARITEHNFAVGKKYFSFERLAELLSTELAMR